MDLPWPLPEHPDLRDRLVRAYDNGRGYHDLRHLAEVLARVDELGAGDDTAVVLAAWYHDAVYDSHGDNEERSARFAEQQLAGTGVDAEEVARLVLLTATHDPADDDHRGAVLCDADLAILAADERRYRAYVAGVRREYASVPEADFRRGRRAVLEDLLAHPTLFRTEHARAHWEQRARVNVEREIAELAQP